MKDVTKAAEATKDGKKGFTRRRVMQGAAALAGGSAASLVLPFASTPDSVASAAETPVFEPVTYEASSKKNIVETDSGKVYGFVRNDIVTYLGVPYGASTAGKNRFMAPGKPKPWTAARAATRWGSVSPQPYTSTVDGRRQGYKYDYGPFMGQVTEGQPGEDCLVANVWTPSITDNKKRAVIVWIHGGGYSTGSDIELTSYDGENLSRRGDVVVVSLNHRLGVLGYMNLSAYGEKWADAGTSAAIRTP
jgi:para-nitrobenzyl esterase